MLMDVTVKDLIRAKFHIGLKDSANSKGGKKHTTSSSNNKNKISYQIYQKAK